VSEPAPRFQFRPRALSSFKSYRRGDFLADLIAGLTVGTVALPLSMALAIASGVNPEAGLYTAIVGGFLIAALGGTRFQIGGPSAAFVVIVYSVLAEFGPEKLVLCTIMAGIILLVMGITRMGSLIKFIPYPVTMGFTAGIAVLIFSTQIVDFLGLNVEEVPVGFWQKMKVLGPQLGTLQPATLALSAGSLAMLILWPARWGKWVPATFATLVAGTLSVVLFNLPVETLGSQFGGIPSGFPRFQLPVLEFSGLGLLVIPATTIALLCAIESLLCAVVTDGMSGDRHDSNQELMAQGVANMVTPFFGGIPVTGAIARTATNVRCGARTPMSGMIHALTLLFIMVVAAPLATTIPLATLSAVLVMIAYRMGEWRMLRRLPRWPKSDTAVYLTTFSLTVLVDIAVAIQVGMVLASLLFIKRVSDASQFHLVDEDNETESGEHSIRGHALPDEVAVFQMFGSFSFGVADRLESSLRTVSSPPRILILRMRSVLAMDATGLNALESLLENLRKRDGHMVLVYPHTQPLMMMEKAGFLDVIGRENLCGNMEEAVRHARELLTEETSPRKRNGPHEFFPQTLCAFPSAAAHPPACSRVSRACGRTLYHDRAYDVSGPSTGFDFIRRQGRGPSFPPPQPSGGAGGTDERN